MDDETEVQAAETQAAETPAADEPQADVPQVGESLPGGAQRREIQPNEDGTAMFTGGIFAPPAEPALTDEPYAPFAAPLMDYRAPFRQRLMALRDVIGDAARGGHPDRLADALTAFCDAILEVI